MKKILLQFLFVLCSYGVYSQGVAPKGGVGVGILSPNVSTILDVVATDKGVLLPRVALTSSTDAVTIKNGNVNSLLVFNTATIADIVPGYYYWYINKWHRLALSDDACGCAGQDGKDGKVGVAGGTGAPGNKGTPGYPGADINIYTDTTTKMVYVQNSDGTWTAINGRDGRDGVDGKSAYDIWHELPGNDGKDVNAFIEGLKGETGAKGDTGAVYIGHIEVADQ